MCLNARGEVIADRILGMGTPPWLVVTPREVMREALRYGATTVLAIVLTRRLREVADLIGVPLNDHIIVGRETYYSFRVGEGWDRR